MASALMIQGTTSDAGKSTMVAGLCRILHQDGYKVAPFKPQNMALNSAVTIDGGEIGRAQALQATACGIAPHTDMNPILLKPESDKTAQVIIQGEVFNKMEAAQYHDYKAIAKQAVLDSYQRLSKQYDIIIAEGAGSPAEINLRHNDLANMGFAEAVDCPVFIVSDIDRGGVFAHLVGTLALLSKSEQKRVAGFIINRFRGDIDLLLPGNQWLEQETGKPVIGTVPFLENLQLDEEDSFNNQQIKDKTSCYLKIIVPVLPRISNHTDFDALKAHPNVNFEFVHINRRIPAADLIILPGSKNVGKDLITLLDNNWLQHIRHHIRYGGKLLGICGGFQMLGTDIFDPNQIESSVQSHYSALGLLSLTTQLMPSKLLKNVTGCLYNDSDKFVSGYEIHCGISEGEALDNPLFTLTSDDMRCEGAVSPDNQIIGTYLHGLFDTPDSCNAILQWAGLNKVHDNAVDINNQREKNLNLLADCLRQNLDMDYIHRLF